MPNAGYPVILVPTYNERENISILIPEIAREAPEAHVLVIDDNSPDGTAGEVRTLMPRYPNLSILSRPRKEGLGAAYKHGISEVLKDKSAELIVFMDADGSHGSEALPKLLEAGKEHDLVIGSRYIRGGGIEKWEWWRFWLSRLGNIYAGIFTRLSIKDLTSGFVCVRADFLKKIDLSRIESSGYAFQIDLKYRIICAGARTIEIPIIFHARREGESKISRHIVTEGLRAPLKIFIEKIFSS